MRDNIGIDEAYSENREVASRVPLPIESEQYNEGGSYACHP